MLLSRWSKKAAASLKQGRKDLALSHLRARKQLDDLLKKRLGSLDLLHSTLIRVEASAGDVKVSLPVFLKSTFLC